MRKSKQIDNSQYKSVKMANFCPNCGNNKGYLLLSGIRVHFAKLVCYDCNHFQKWISKNRFDYAAAKDLINF